MGSYFGFQNFKYIQSSNLGFSNVSEQKNISQSKGKRDKHEFNTCQYGFMLLLVPAHFHVGSSEACAHHIQVR